jgi:hypothetical protein
MPVDRAYLLKPGDPGKADQAAFKSSCHDIRQLPKFSRMTRHAVGFSM